MVGDVGVGRVYLNSPSGSAPMHGSSWYMQEQVYSEEKIPQWAIICAIVGFFFVCILSLFFLLVKEKTVSGYVDITVVNGEFRHQSRVMVSNPMQLDQLRQLLASAQQYAAAAPAPG
jgi:hypothetical protein